MSQQEQFQSFENNNEDSINIKEIIERYLRHWKWFALTVIVSVGVAYLYLQSTLPTYNSSAKLLIEDDKKAGSGSSELDVFKDLGIFGGVSNLQNEIELLKSRSLIAKVVSELDLQKRYYEKSSNFFGNKPELFNTNPIELEITDSLKISKTLNIDVHLKKSCNQNGARE